jgi:hypothetical protein
MHGTDAGVIVAGGNGTAFQQRLLALRGQFVQVHWLSLRKSECNIIKSGERRRIPRCL